MLIASLNHKKWIQAIVRSTCKEMHVTRAGMSHHKACSDCRMMVLSRASAATIARMTWNGAANCSMQHVGWGNMHLLQVTAGLRYKLAGVPQHCKDSPPKAAATSHDM